MGNIQAIVEIIDGNCLAAQMKLTESIPMKKVRKPKSCDKSDNLFSVFNSPKLSNLVVKKTALSKRQTRPKLHGSNLQSIPEVELYTNDLLESEIHLNIYDKASGFDNFSHKTCENISVKKKKRKFNNENSGSDGFDKLYPDSITPEKIRKYFSNELSFELPFIDDLEFFDGEWYIGSDNIWLYIPDNLPVSSNNNSKFQGNLIRESGSSSSSGSSSRSYHNHYGHHDKGSKGLLMQLIRRCCFK